MKILIFLALSTLTFKVYSQQLTQAQVDSIIKISYATEEIAPDFTGTNTMLVVVKGSQKNVNKYLENDLKKVYTGDYQLLEQGEALNSKDTSKARFFVMVFDRSSLGRSTDIGRISGETQYRMAMVDRKTGKLYNYKETSSCYTCLFKKYFKKLDNLRTELK